jgi:hypothetical protein
MTSRLLRNLDELIARLDGTVQADCARGNKAVQLMRLGEPRESAGLLAMLHAKYDLRPDARISCWLHLADAISAIYISPMGQPEDSLKRCMALAKATGNREMQALASAWRTHLAYGAYDHIVLENQLGEVLATATSENHQALSRGKLIGAVALHLCGRYDLARSWYADVHRHATEEGDEATLSALMHNLACMSVANLRQLTLDPTGVEIVNAAGPNALEEANSTASYDDLIGSTGLSTWIRILQAQALALQGQPAEACEIYDANMADAREQGLERVMGYMYADLAWCRAQTGQMEEAQLDADAAEKLIGPAVLVDDRAATHSRLAQLYDALGAPDVAARHCRCAAQAWKEFHAFQIIVVQKLKPMVDESA